MRALFRWLLGLIMIVVGALHFLRPAGFVKIVPGWLPAPLGLVLVSGGFEVLGGVGLLVPHVAVRRAASRGLIALFVAVFPANVNMALNGIQPDAVHLPTWSLWARLPLQLVLIAWAWWVGRAPPDRGAKRP